MTTTISEDHIINPDLRRKSPLLSPIGSYPKLSNYRVLGILLLSAFVITTARMLAPFEVGKDQSVQLESAQRLASGLGLTTTNDTKHQSSDLSELPTPGYLVHWPPGFSLIVAAFLLTGLPLLVSLKIIYFSVTLLGWFGWAIIASRLLSEPIKLGNRELNVHYLMVALLPIFTTPLWKGTDVFLWAGIPFFVLLLFKASTGERSFVPLVLAGLLLGLLCAIRYASVFLALAAVLILLQGSYPNIKLFLKRLLVFLLPLLVAGLSVISYVKLSAHNPSGISTPITPTSGLLAGVPDKVQSILNGLPVTSNLIFGFPLLDQLLTTLNIRPLNYAVGLICLSVIFCLPLIVMRSRRSIAQRWQEDLALSLSLLPLSLTTFLIITRLISDSSLFKIRRYYEPLILCTIFVCYEIASKRAARRAVKATSIGIVTIFLAYLLVFNSALFIMPERRGQLVQSVLSYTPASSARQHSTSQSLSFPSWRFYSWKESSRLKVKQLYTDHPDALFIAQEYPLYVFDGFQGGGPVPGRNIIDFPGMPFLEQAYTSKAIKVFWVLNSETKLSAIAYSRLKLIAFDSVERTSIYESDFPAGYKLFGVEQ